MARRKKGEYPIRKGAPPTLQKRGTYPWDKVRPGEYFVVGPKEHPNTSSANKEWHPHDKHFMTKTVGREKRIYCVSYAEWKKLYEQKEVPEEQPKGKRTKYPFKEMKIGQAVDLQIDPNKSKQAIASSVYKANKDWAHARGKHFTSERISDKTIRVHCVKATFDHLK